MEDIEDIVSSAGLATRVEAGGGVVKIKSVVAPSKRVGEGLDAIENDVVEEEEVSKEVPGTGKIFVKTYGCSHNISDSEYMAGMLVSYGYSITENREDANLCLVNSCTVKDPSQAAFMHLVEKARAEGQPVVVAGCVPQADKKIKGLADVSQVGIAHIDRVVEVVEESLKGNTVKLLTTNKALPSLDLPKVRKNPLVEIIPLSTGCLGSCTYCKTKHARGVLGSYALETLVSRVDAVSADGVAEIWMTSEDTGAYGRDIGSSIAELLERTVAALPEGVMLRVGMTNPPFILEHLEAVAAALNHPRVFSFLHIPVQAGSDDVLTAMNREYTRGDFETVADYLIAHVPDVTVATDIICGFPTETEAMFDETLTLMQKYKLAIVNISQFYPRPGTPAARMKRISTKVVKDRSRRMSAMFNAFTPYTHLPGRRARVWFNTEVSDDGRSVGHTKSYVKVLVTLDTSLPGTSHEVNLTACSRFHVDGTVVVGTKEGFTQTERDARRRELVVKGARSVNMSSSARGGAKDKWAAAVDVVASDPSDAVPSSTDSTVSVAMGAVCALGEHVWHVLTHSTIRAKFGLPVPSALKALGLRVRWSVVQTLPLRYITRHIAYVARRLLGRKALADIEGCGTQSNTPRSKGAPIRNAKAMRRVPANSGVFGEGFMEATSTFLFVGGVAMVLTGFLRSRSRK